MFLLEAITQLVAATSGFYTTTPSEGSQNPQQLYLIVGIVIAVSIVLGIIVALLWVFGKQKKKQPEEEKATVEANNKESTYDSVNVLRKSFELDPMYPTATAPVLVEDQGLGGGISW